jgi:hypothetical protein
VRRDGFAVEPLRLLAEPVEEGGSVINLAQGFGQRLALLQRHDLGEVALVAQHQLGPAAQDRAALLGR